MPRERGASPTEDVPRGGKHYEDWLERRAKRSRPTGFSRKEHVREGNGSSHVARSVPHAPPPPPSQGFFAVPLPLVPAGTRHARRVYVGGIPEDIKEHELATCFASALQSVGGAGEEGETGCVLNVYVNREKKFAFVEFATVRAASNALALDGLSVKGVALRVRRPNDYNPIEAQGLGPTEPDPRLNLEAVGLQKTGGESLAHPDRIFVGGLPHFLNEQQCRELLESFGKLRHFDLVMDRETGNSKGYAFALYEDTSVTDTVCENLNGMDMGGKSITVRRASQKPPGHGPGVPLPMMAMQGLGATLAPVVPPSRAIVLDNMVTDEQLRDDQEYQDIFEDVQEECETYGKVLEVFIPRSTGDQPAVRALGKIFVHYEELESALKAKQALHGRMFDGRRVDASFFDEQRFLARALE